MPLVTTLLTQSRYLGMSEVQVDSGILLLWQAACQAQGREGDRLCWQRPHRAYTKCKRPQFPTENLSMPF